MLLSALFTTCEEGDLASLEQLSNSYGLGLFNIENEVYLKKKCFLVIIITLILFINRWVKRFYILVLAPVKSV